MKKEQRKLTVFYIILIVALAVCFFGSLALGKYPLNLKDVANILTHYLFGAEANYEHAAETAFLQVRLPRLAACMFAGTALTVSGATYQGVFRNPMVSPDLLGASSGAAFGSCCAILLSASTLVMHITAFIFGIFAVALTYLVSTIVSRRENTTLTLLLTGMVVSSMFNAGVSITKTLADTDDKLGEITFWLMGSMTHMRLNTILILVVPVLVGVMPILLFSYRLNLLSFGDEEAKALGVNVKAMRLIFIACATLITSASVAACGMVGWVGIVIPHLMRMVVGPDYHKLIPAAALSGALFLLLVDNITRIFFQVEVAIGILTALIGAPFFLILLVNRKDGWQ